MYSVIRYQSPAFVLPAQIDLDDVGVVDLAQRADLPAYGVVAGGVVEELEGALLALDVVAHPVDLREAALAEDVEDLEPPVDDVADRVVGGLGADRRLHLAGSGSGSTSLSPAWRAAASLLTLGAQPVLELTRRSRRPSRARRRADS